MIEDRYCVITENDESNWDDVTGEIYHFPKRYLKMLQPNTKLIYYKGKIKNIAFRDQRLTDEPHYFGIARIGKNALDPLSNKEDYFSEVLDYQPFLKPVLAKQNNQFLEHIPDSKMTNYWRDAVREITEDIFFKILSQAKIAPVKVGNQTKLPEISNDFESYHLEGKKKFRFTSYYERKLIYRKQAIEFHGYSCMACGFNFEKVYGPFGKNFIHVHHIKPLSELPEAMQINPKIDMIVLCPNCHSMIHREKNKTLTLEELRSFIKKS